MLAGDRYRRISFLWVSCLSLLFPASLQAWGTIRTSALYSDNRDFLHTNLASPATLAGSDDLQYETLILGFFHWRSDSSGIAMLVPVYPGREADNSVAPVLPVLSHLFLTGRQGILSVTVGRTLADAFGTLPVSEGMRLAGWEFSGRGQEKVLLDIRDEASVTIAPARFTMTLAAGIAHSSPAPTLWRHTTADADTWPLRYQSAVFRISAGIQLSSDWQFTTGFTSARPQRLESNHRGDAGARLPVPPDADLSQWLWISSRNFFHRADLVFSRDRDTDGPFRQQNLTGYLVSIQIFYPWGDCVFRTGWSGISPEYRSQNSAEWGDSLLQRSIPGLLPALASMYGLPSRTELPQTMWHSIYAGATILPEHLDLRLVVVDQPDVIRVSLIEAPIRGKIADLEIRVIPGIGIPQSHSAVVAADAPAIQLSFLAQTAL